MEQESELVAQANERRFADSFRRAQQLARSMAELETPTRADQLRLMGLGQPDMVRWSVTVGSREVICRRTNPDDIETEVVESHRAPAGQARWVTLNLGQEERIPGAVYRLPFRTAQGQPGEVYLELSLERVLSDAGSLKVFRTGYAFLVDQDGDCLIPTPAGPRRARIQPGWNPEDPSPRLVRDPISGQPAWLSATPLLGRELALVVVFPVREVLEPLERLKWNSVGLGAVALLLLVAIITTTASSVTRPLARLVEASARVGRGELEAPEASAGRDETARLSRAFSGMVSDLKAHVVERERLVARQERLTRELEIGSSVQISILPRTSLLDPARRYALAARSIPAREVGGDFYDYFELPDGRWAMVVADVSGKGIPAALYTVLTRTVVKAALLETLSPGPSLARANQIMSLSDSEHMFVTALVALLDRRDGTLRLASAGHPAPVLLRGDQTTELEVPNGLVLGVDPSAAYPEQEISLHPGDLLLFYTDGLSEARNPAGDLLGEEALRSLVRQAGAPRAASAIEAAEALERLWASLEEFCAGAPPSDDRTAMILTFRASL